MQKFKSVEELINQLKPEKPVYCIRKKSIESSVKFFLDKFPGKILYAVKTNPHPEVIQTILNTGVNQFDVASIEEIKAIRKLTQNAKCSYMHTVKSRESIKEAYFNYGVKTFSLDTKEELIKIIESTNNAKDLELFVRVAVSNEHAEIDLSKKFGALTSEASDVSAPNFLDKSISACSFETATLTNNSKSFALFVLSIILINSSFVSNEKVFTP